MDIKINESWSISGDNYNWTVHNWYDGKDKNKQHKRQCKDSYYNNLAHALKVISEKSLLGCKSADDILTRLESLDNDIRESLAVNGIN